MWSTALHIRGLIRDVVGHAIFGPDAFVICPFQVKLVAVNSLQSSAGTPSTTNVSSFLLTELELVIHIWHHATVHCSL